MTPLQKQALFTLRQAVALCEAAGIEICGHEQFPSGVYLSRPDPVFNPWRLSVLEIDEFEKELGE